MPERLKIFFQRWIISTVAVLVATFILRDGITFGNWRDLLVATLLLGLLNSFLRPLLVLLSLPLLVVTLGLFSIVINAVLLLLVSALLGDHFQVDGFWNAFWGALIISVVSLVLNSLTGTGGTRVTVQRTRAPKSKDNDEDVIDI